MQNNLVMRAQNLVKSYSLQTHNDTPVLKNISLDIQRGEFLALVGASGVGKSTLLHILGTLDTPDEGSVEFFSRDGNKNLFQLGSEQLASIRSKKIGFIFQFHHLLPEFTALENIMMPLLVAGAAFRDARQKSENLIQKVGLSQRANHRPKELSGGEQQRIAIARSLVNQPEIIFADEPTGNLDTANANTILEIIRRLVEEFSTTFVVATHSTEVAAAASRMLIMKDGKIISGERAS